MCTLLKISWRFKFEEYLDNRDFYTYYVPDCKKDGSLRRKMSTFLFHIRMSHCYLFQEFRERPKRQSQCVFRDRDFRGRSL